MTEASGGGLWRDRRGLAVLAAAAVGLLLLLARRTPPGAAPRAWATAEPRLQPTHVTLFDTVGGLRRDE